VRRGFVRASRAKNFLTVSFSHCVSLLVSLCLGGSTFSAIDLGAMRLDRACTTHIGPETMAFY
jgi:hypothetical protein